MTGIYVVLVALLVASVSCTPAVPRAGLDDTIKQALESFKQKMNTSQLGLPPLDPFELSHLDLNIDQEIATLKGSIDNLKVTKLSTFNVENVKLNILSLSLTFNISLNELDLTGDYDVDGNIGGGMLPVYGNGPFSIILGDLWVSGVIKIGSNNTFLYIKSFDLDYNLGSSDINLSGLLGGGELGDVLNQVISDMLPKLATSYKPQISKAASDLVVNMANKLLDGMTLSDLLDLINGKKTTAAAASATTVAAVY